MPESPASLALLPTVAADAVRDHLAGRRPTPEPVARAGIESYSAAYWWAAGFFAVGLVVTALLYRRRENA